MKISIFFTITVILLMSKTTICVQKTPTPLKEEAIIWDETDVADTKKHNQKHYKDYMAACYQHRKGNAHESFKAYKKILNQAHKPEIYDGFIRLLFETGQFNAIVKLYEQKKQIFETKFNKNTDIRLMIAQAFLYVDNGPEAEKQLTQLHEQHKNNELIAYYMAVTKLKNNNPAQALMFIEKCINQPSLKQKHFLFNFLAAKVYLQMNNPEKALHAINKSLQQYPKFDQGILFKATLLEQQGKVDDAIKQYQQFLHLVEHHHDIEKQLVSMLFTQKRFSEASDQLRHMGGSTPEYHYDLALIELNAGKRQEALTNIEAALKKSSHFTKAKLLKIEILLALSRKNDACSFMEQWLIDEPDNLAIVNLTLMLKKAHLTNQQLIQIFTNVITQKQSILLHSALADLYLENQQYKEAHEHYKKALACTNNETIKVKIHYQIAYTHLKIDQKEKAIDELKKIITTTSYPPACNLLAYLYAQSGQHLPQALKLIDQALKQKPERNDFIHTKGIVLLKLKNKKEAISTLKKALDCDPANLKIQQHLKEAVAQ